VEIKYFFADCCVVFRKLVESLSVRHDPTVHASRVCRLESDINVYFIFISLYIYIYIFRIIFVSIFYIVRMYKSNNKFESP